MGAEEVSLSPKVRQVLAVLALRSGTVITQDSLVAELWAEEPPRSATTTMQTYVYQLRQAVEALDGSCVAGEVVRTESPGYLLSDIAIDVDVVRFRVLVNNAKAHLRTSAEDALSFGRHALNIVRGAPMADVRQGQLLRGSAVRLGEEIMATHELVIEAQLMLRRYSEVIVELYEQCARNPLREGFYYQLMTALAKTGRRSEALDVYAQLTRILRDELGIDPSQSFRRLHMQILEGADEHAPYDSQLA
ncbi:AfsR/SARP family transcriptional regulator [Rhodococcus sp. IEGM 1318]|uniref:AfsR/SARP family transcriptional regulator n=1 Tax=Rhodococcus sp. IEGM 1318 TaxID=3082226 RepID=UPI002955C0E8|nr:AfsR/SARP family transcriptional regulator [Rhodococcus sp. IEGM 1318]MDV8009338.1 AfsR/SARP family transcriptional regulator [Rhodococcus sp. IEGM 1318]